MRNEIALAARDLRGGRKNVGTVATTTMKRCSSSPQQQQNVIAKFSPGSPPSMAFTSDSLEIDDDDYVMVTSPGTGFVPRNPCTHRLLPNATKTRGIAVIKPIESKRTLSNWDECS